MSTHSKTNAVAARDGKDRRKEVVRAFRIQAVKHRGSLMGEAYAAIAHKLESVRVNPRLSGAQKEAKFKELIQSIAKL